MGLSRGRDKLPRQGPRGRIVYQVRMHAYRFARDSLHSPADSRVGVVGAEMDLTRHDVDVEVDAQLHGEMTPGTSIAPKLRGNASRSAYTALPKPPHDIRGPKSRCCSLASCGVVLVILAMLAVASSPVAISPLIPPPAPPLPRLPREPPETTPPMAPQPATSPTDDVF